MRAEPGRGRGTERPSPTVLRGCSGLVAVALVLLGLGAWQAAQAGAASHNHLCHAHNSDSCGQTHDEDGHTHRLGGWAAEQEQEL